MLSFRSGNWKIFLSIAGVSKDWNHWGTIYSQKSNNVWNHHPCKKKLFWHLEQINDSTPKKLLLFFFFLQFRHTYSVNCSCCRSLENPSKVLGQVKVYSFASSDTWKSYNSEVLSVCSSYVIVSDWVHIFLYILIFFFFGFCISRTQDHCI